VRVIIKNECRIATLWSIDFKVADVIVMYAYYTQ